MLLLTTAEVAVILRVHPRTLKTWRAEKRGPAWIRVEGKVMYAQADLDAYMKVNRLISQQVS